MGPVIILLMGVLAVIVLLILGKVREPGAAKGEVLGEVLLGGVMIALVLVMLAVVAGPALFS